MRIPERVRCIMSCGGPDDPKRGHVYHVTEMLGTRFVLLGCPNLWKGKEVGHNYTNFRVLRYNEN